MKKSISELSRREFRRIAGLSGAGATLAACGLRPTTTNMRSTGPIQLVYQDWRTEWFPAMAQKMLDQFNAEHPDIQVFYISDPENLEEKMPQDFAAGTAPDVLAGCCEFFPAWANAGYLLDLRPYVQADLDPSTIRDWSQAQYQAFFTQDGKQYALPKYHGALALYYNKDIFAEANVEYPTNEWSYEDYLAAMKQLTRLDGDTTIRWGSMFDVTWDRIQMHVNGWGGHYVNPDDPRKCDMADPPAQEALEWLRARIWDDHVMATVLDVEGMETREAFIQQRIAMVEDGSWALRDILEAAEFRIGVAPFPVGPERRVTLATTDGFAIYSDTKYPEAAWEFLKFLISEDYGRAMATDHLLQPARSSLIPVWVDAIRKAYPEKAKDVDIAAFADGHIKGYSVISDSFVNMVGVSEIADEVWDQIYTLGKSPVSEMATVCQQIEALQSQSGLIPSSCGCEFPG
jgi:multiple sugar transport system substrate-binding protein